MTAIEPASSTALDFDTLERQANMLASSSIVPAQYRKKPGDIVAAAMMGHELGFAVMTSLRSIHVVDGKPQLSAEAMNAIVRRAGHSITGETSAKAATATGVRRDNGDTMTATFTIDDAQRAGLKGANWQKYPSAMLWARAVSMVCRELFPDVALGSYTLGELAEPEEYVQPARGDVIDTDTTEPVVAMADPAETAAVFDRIEAATPEQQTALLRFMEERQLVLTEPAPREVLHAINGWFVTNTHRQPEDEAQ